MTDVPRLGLPEPEVQPQAPLPDRNARERIRNDLETNLLVEAGAGSGKTTALVDRMVSLVATGAAQIGQVAAVTFTRKAAAELRERFQAALEKALSEQADSATADRLHDALKGIDQAFVGTIHAFCAHLLRERPIEAGLDPGFEEMLEAENARLRSQYWGSFMERLVSDQDPVLDELDRLGLSIHQLKSAYLHLAENLDVTFPAEDLDPPSPEDLASLQAVFDELLDRTQALMPRQEPPDGWDDLQRRARGWLFERRVTGWTRPADLIDTVLDVTSRQRWKVTQKRWDPAGGRCEPAKLLAEDFTAFVAPGGPARTFLDRWFAHRYPTVIEVARRAAHEYADYRLSSGRLSFQDLLLITARLLRSSPAARRQLGRRYTRLLVDEFQDTDPIQAEVAFLLASDPAGPDDTDPRWWDCTPRPGALFVVGDPKQSIYRFRRADIGIYNQVKERFEAFGAVLGLLANFRSTLSIAGIVNDVFQDVFPETPTPYQAGFAPMLPQRPDLDADGVYGYTLDASTVPDLIAQDARWLATWIGERVAAKERVPGDFMILTWRKRGLARYARELEAHGLPVDVAGAGVGYEETLEELMAILRALLDPENELHVVRVLTGLFFGIDLDTLVDHKLSGQGFSFLGLRRDPSSPVTQALARMHGWWDRSRREPADVLINRLVTELGLFAHAAAGDLGSLRTGALVYALDAVRAQAVAGDTSLLGALEALEGALDWDDAEAPLEPGRTDAVRVMNVHKAKGLEAPVVILAGPSGGGGHPVDLKVERDPEHGALGWLSIVERSGEGYRTRKTPVAWPASWHEKEEDEAHYEGAEHERLLYVAATRARDELVVSRREGGRSKSPWALFEPWLDRHATALTVAEADPPGVDRLDRTADSLLEETRLAAAERSRQAEPTYLFSSVTDLTKGGTLEAPGPPADATEGRDTPAEAEASRPAAPSPGSRTAPRGYEWGSVVHEALALAARGLEGEAFAQVCRSLLIQEERPVAPDGAPTELNELLELVERVRASDLWIQAMAAPERHSELTFVAPRPGSEGDVPEMIEGVIDLAYNGPNGWVIADFKTDVGDDPDFPRRSSAYRMQVELYAACWSAMTGETVGERVLLYTAQDREERW